MGDRWGAAFVRIGWQASFGLGGSFAPDWVAGITGIRSHSRGEYARDDDSDGFHEVHVNTMEGFWSLLRSWLRPHRGISQDHLPLYLGFFEFVHNVRRRGKAL